MSQGSLFDDLPDVDSSKFEAAQLSNQKFCEQIEQCLTALGYREVKNAPCHNEYLKNAPYTDMYGATRRAAFLIQHQRLGTIRVEAHKQEQSGSVDQKFPFFLQSLRLAPEQNLVILLGGGGYKPLAFEWIKNAASEVTDKEINVFSDVNQFIDFLEAD